VDEGLRSLIIGTKNYEGREERVFALRGGEKGVLEVEGGTFKKAGEQPKGEVKKIQGKKVYQGQAAQ